MVISLLPLWGEGIETTESPAEDEIQPEIITTEKTDHEVTPTADNEHREASTDLFLSISDEITQSPVENKIQPEIITAEKVATTTVANGHKNDLTAPIYSECLEWNIILCFS